MNNDLNDARARETDCRCSPQHGGRPQAGIRDSDCGDRDACVSCRILLTPELGGCGSADKVDGVAVGQEAGFTEVNSRTIWDAGGMLGYCTDSGYDALAGLEHELKTYNAMFSMQDMVKIMGPNTASYIQMGSQLGTLEAGKLADIVLLDGSPMEGYWNWLRTKVVLKGGVVVVDKR